MRKSRINPFTNARSICKNRFLRFGVLSVILLVGECVFAQSNKIDSAIASFPDIRVGLYRSDIAVHSVNTLIAAGKDEAYPALDRRIAFMVSTRDNQSDAYEHYNQSLCHLIRLLFTPANNSFPLRPPKLGLLQSMPVLTMNKVDWPDLPFFITNGVPLSLNFGYSLTGIAEDAGDYFRYCKSNGVFRTEFLTNPTYIAESDALKKLFVSGTWKSLKWRDIQFGFSYDLDRVDIESRLLQQLTNLDAFLEMNGSVTNHP